MFSRSFNRSILISALSLAMVSGIAAQIAGELKLEPRVFESARGEKADVEYGRLYVPENRKVAGSRLIELAFVWFKSTSQNPGPPIVYLAGGPGGSGIGAARGSRFPLFLAMREVGDVIAFDQRGTGNSVPNLGCTENFTIPAGQAITRDGAGEQFRALSRTCAARLKQKGIDLLGYNTNESADDLEDLRKAIGAPKLSLWGISYGTHLALAMIKRHEKSIDKVILAGVEGPEHTAKLPSTTQKHLEHLDQLARSDNELSRDVPSLVKLIKSVLDAVDDKPVLVEVTDPRTKQKVGVTINKFSLQLLTAFSFGLDEAGIPAIYYAMSKGDYSIAAQRLLGFTGGTQNIGSGMSFMMDCYSGTSAARRKRIAAEAKTTLLGDVLDFPFPDVCEAWGNPDLGDGFRKNPRSRIPALFISGTLDVRTPPSNAEEVRRGFSNSVHLIIDGAVHSDPLFLSSPKIKDVMLEFIKGQKVSTTSIALPAIKFKPLKK